MSKNIDIIQMKVTKDREKEWKQFTKRSRYPMTSDQLYEAIVLANKFLKIEESAKPFLQIATKHLDRKMDK